MSAWIPTTMVSGSDWACTFATEQTSSRATITAHSFLTLSLLSRHVMPVPTDGAAPRCRRAPGGRDRAGSYPSAHPLQFLPFWQHHVAWDNSELTAIFTGRCAAFSAFHAVEDTDR